MQGDYRPSHKLHKRRFLLLSKENGNAAFLYSKNTDVFLWLQNISDVKNLLSKTFTERIFCIDTLDALIIELKRADSYNRSIRKNKENKTNNNFSLYSLNILNSGGNTMKNQPKSVEYLINQPHHTEEQKEKARKVMDFYVYLFDKEKADVDKALDLVGPTYVQHNPCIPDGREGLRSWAPDRAKEGTSFEFYQLTVDEDLVFVRLKLYRPQCTSGRGEAGVDLFRFENGKIVEHWDVIQEVPEKSLNDNTMF